MGMRLLLVAALIAVASVAWAESYTKTHTFSDATTAEASEVNANFDEIATEVNENDSRIDAATVVTTHGNVTALTNNQVSGAYVTAGVDASYVDTGELPDAVIPSTIMRDSEANDMHTGSGSPGAQTCATGDLWLETTTPTLYGCTSTDTWEAL
jgi:hypothetical protein